MREWVSLDEELNPEGARLWRRFLQLGHKEAEAEMREGLHPPLPVVKAILMTYIEQAGRGGDVIEDLKYAARRVSWHAKQLENRRKSEKRPLGLDPQRAKR